MQAGGGGGGAGGSMTAAFQCGHSEQRQLFLLSDMAGQNVALLFKAYKSLWGHRTKYI